MHSPLYELTVARTKEFLRQGEALFWVFVFPLLVALALGFAFREKQPDRIPIGVVESPDAARLMKALAASPVLVARLYPEENAKEALRTGKISLLIEARSPIVYRFDPTRPDSRVARLEADDALQRAAGRRSAFESREEQVTERGSRYIDFLLPGLLGMNLMGTGMWGIGFSIVTARQQKLLKRLIATPMRKSDYLLAQMFSRLVFLVFEVVTLVVFGWLVFDVGVRGSLLTFSLTSLLGAIAFSGIGLLVAARPETLEGVSGLMNLVMVPMWLFSGVFFSAQRFPDWAQPYIKALPLTALNDALRSVMIEGSAITEILGELAILTVWAIVSFAVALRIFRWK